MPLWEALWTFVEAVLCSEESVCSGFWYWKNQKRTGNRSDVLSWYLTRLTVLTYHPGSHQYVGQILEVIRPTG